MDGTLTMPIHDFNDIRRQLGIKENTPILEAIKQMPKDQAVAVNSRLHDIEMKIASLARPQPGAESLLQDLAKNGCRLGIVTRNDEDIAQATLTASGLDQFFEVDHVIGRETCAPKPEPDGVLHLLSKWRASPRHTVMVGDYLYDIEAGKRAGVRTVHFDSSGLFQWPEFTDHRVTRIGDIKALRSQSLSN